MSTELPESLPEVWVDQSSQQAANLKNDRVSGGHRTAGLAG